jgi:hypothetical protein
MGDTVVIGATTVSEVSIEAQVIRCGCRARGQDPLLVHGWDEVQPTQLNPCPQPLRVEDKGVISYSHRNPFRRWWWAIKHAWELSRDDNVSGA